VRHATFTETAVLTMTLENGTTIKAQGHPEVETWEVVGPGKLLVVAVGGGDEVAIRS
jgi:hypothetical protein